MFPSVIFRYINDHKRRGNISEDIISKQLTEIIESMKEDLTQDVADEIKKKNKELSVKSAILEAKHRIAERWNNNALSLLSGKTIIKRLSSWSQMNYGVSFNAVNLAQAFHQEEVFVEVRDLIKAIISGNKL